MNRRLVAGLALLTLVSTPVLAQAPKPEPPRPFVYSTYHVCNLADQ